MYLKVRDCDGKQWWYIHNFDRLVVNDVTSVEANDSDEASKKLSDTMQSTKSNLLIFDNKYSGRGNYMRINCITDRKSDQPQKEYSVVFNTYAFLCNENGDTMDRFIVNRD